MNPSNLPANAGPEECPSPGTAEYDAYVERQAHNALVDATNAHPLLRVFSTIVILILGGGALAMTWESYQRRPLWMGILSTVVLGVYSLSVFAYLRYSWGRRRK